ncbi:troponin C, isoallergen Bla g 6.0201-like [Belonocnema kinseyi]|uniref:troponin C, isoallergen Bla g 6.0201-like n=1 Tax=Belonocnema kinseyi TaxID=2817044 RepID=UPI00143D2364|nr:troponin C, isoallergen Bla g 6.0201-like [Belonocnema kinseyi]
METLSKDLIAQLRMGFNAFDIEKKGTIKTDQITVIFSMMGKTISSEILDEAIAEADPFSAGELEFEEFATLAAKFIEEDQDEQATLAELKEAFRLYDKEGNGYITTEVFRDILHELDENLSPEELDMMIEEIDADGSGTLDFDEFLEAMTK